jgi:hypothetical protein
MRFDPANIGSTEEYLTTQLQNLFVKMFEICSINKKVLSKAFHFC